MQQDEWKLNSQLIDDICLNFVLNLFLGLETLY